MSATVPLICIAIGAALGFAAVQGMKAQLKSVHKAGSAANYVRPGSMNLTGKQDLFLYSNVNRVKRETKSSSSGGGGGVTKYAVAVSPADNGKVTPDKTSAAKGSVVTITAMANDGYALDTIKQPIRPARKSS